MCGICGIIDLRGGAEISPESLERMSASIEHRGPDDSGQWIGTRVGIAMRRLSIVDLGGGHQPISNETSDCWIVFNGEIYNHVALRQELERRGHTFKTASDTEVILHLYEEEGERAFRRLDGMFAVAIVDERRGAARPRLVLARDRLGKKPLFYAEQNGTLLFGSEIKAILAHGSVRKELDLDALHHYLSLLFVPAPLSMYRGIRKLPPASLLVSDETGTSIRSYWDLREVVGSAHPSRSSSTTAHIRELLFEAVRKRIDLEVPFGAFLSGGLDSGVVVAIMSELLGTPVRTFSMGFEGPASHNELPTAALSARHFRTDHHELMTRPDVVALVHDLVEFADDPLAISSCIPLLVLSRAARQEVKVVLTGDGGDEVFGGYPVYQLERWASAWRALPGFVDGGMETLARAARSAPSAQVRRAADRVERFVANTRRSTGARRLGWTSGFSEQEKWDLYSPAMRDSARRETPDYLESHLSRFESASPQTNANLLDLLVWLPDEMLAKVDRMTMAASLEARSPLLDDDLVTYLEGISFDDKVAVGGGKRGKELLRAAVADLLPPHLLEGKKLGFNVPLDDWFRGGAGSFLESILAPERIARRGVFDPSAVTGWVDGHRQGKVNASNRLFALVVFEVWAERYL